MILLLLYWCYLLFAFSIAGIGVQQLFKLHKLHPVLTPVIGSIGLTFFAGCWAFIGPLDWIFDCCLIGIILGMGLLLKESVRSYFSELKQLVYHLPIQFKVLAGLIVLLAALKSAGFPTIVDNESYYIQTIKWLDQYGWVKGLANLHPFLGQQSGWHLMHSAFNFNSLNINLNDLNGFYLSLANIYAFGHLSQVKENTSKHYLIIGLFPIFNIFLFQFIDAPSPDLGIYLMGYFIFSEYLKKSEYAPSSLLTLLSLLTFWAVFIKGTGVFLSVFPLIYLIHNKSKIETPSILKIVVSGIFFSLLFLGKNFLISGYPLFPLDFASLDVVWKLPNSIMDFLSSQMQPSGYKMSQEQLETTSTLGKLKHWLLLPKLTGLFNIGVSLLLVIFPFFIRKSSHFRAFFWLYVATVGQMILLWATSPQYRFFFGFMMLMILVLLSKFMKHSKMIPFIFSIVWIGILAVICLPSVVGKLSTNSLQYTPQSFMVSQLFSPHGNSQYEGVKFSEENKKNLTYYTPKQLAFFWGTGNGPLPCVQKEQLDYFETYYKCIPQPIEEELDSGFFSLELE